ncbi:FxSxx-COOH cyclophane-containing RiPP peptide [Streptomyces sp. HUAS TT20]|uniref:FxSxx-COOH cyclophane-containing RiPP peptide n=1 Tax=Streptomyces sp. HUAS TT20 TaxID=3447509 RepID=UPI0021DB411D|nr:FxSxx-COOH cyclophane-containing RiPP peptide [Streptomyces sp. HUAS 15-9]UXY31367.1 FxSxx-COOH protein [Streptomyces sp. HUAS 15-9]
MPSRAGERTADMPDLTGLPLERILDGADPALAAALHRVLRHLAGEELPVAAYDSGGDSSEGPPPHAAPEL